MTVSYQYPFLTPGMFEAVGDGITDDTAALNRMLVRSAQLGISCVSPKGAVYRVTPSGSKNFLNPAGGVVANRLFCVEQPTGSKVNWNGAQIMFAAGVDAVVYSNKSTQSAGDVIVCENLTIDGGGAADTVRTLSMTWWYGLAVGSSLYNITVQNCSYTAASVSNCTDTKFDQLIARDIRGQAWILGGNTFDKLKRCEFGTVSAYRIKDYGTFNQPGNGFLIGGDDLTFVRILQRNCGGGVKIAPNSTSIHIDQCITDGTVLAGETDFNTQNGGFKVQGEDALSKCDLITVGTVKSKKAGGAGMFIRFTGSLIIGTYESDHCATLGLDPDVDVASTDRLIVGRMISQWAGYRGVDFGSGMTYADIDELMVYNASEVTEANSSGFRPLSGQFHVNSLQVIDDRVTKKAIVALGILAAGTVGVIQRYRTNLSNRMDVRSTQVEIRNARFDTGTSPLSGRVTLTAAATQTVVSNNNSVSQTVTGGFVEPVILVTPINALARTLGIPYYFIPSTFNFTLVHPAATGGEIYEYTLLGYRLDAVKKAA